MAQEYQKFEEMLKKEKELLAEELRQISQKSKEHPGGWVPKRSELDTDRASDDEVADAFEDIGERMALETELEGRLIEVETALNKMGNGTYGTCEVCGKFIEPKRLEANPAARTCVAHLH